MSHNVETMAYTGQVPWHGLGVRVNNDLSPEQMMKAAGLDWNVKAVAGSAKFNGKHIPLPVKGLVRESDGSLLTVITKNWNPVQNSDAFNFFDEFVRAGEMEMHTAGSLRGGKIVWVLAKVNESFEVLKKDKVDSYMLLTNPHLYGKRMSCRSTQIRVVCNNTLDMAFAEKSELLIKFDHRVAFDPDRIKEALGISAAQRKAYKEAATFLATSRAKEEDLVAYFNTVFPKKKAETETKADKDELSKNTALFMDILNKQPGADLFPGTWWNAFNAVTYAFDHVRGKDQNVRLDSAWYGFGANAKAKALKTALDMAS